MDILKIQQEIIGTQVGGRDDAKKKIVLLLTSALNDDLKNVVSKDSPPQG